MKQQRGKPTKKDSKKPKNIKKAKKKIHQQEENEHESDASDDLSSIYDSEQESEPESFDEQSFEDMPDGDDDGSLGDFQKEIEEQCAEPKPAKLAKREEESKNYSVEEKPILEEKSEQNIAEEEEKKRQLEEIQRIRLEKYLKKPSKGINQTKEQSEVGEKIKFQNDQKLSLLPEPSEQSHWNQPQEFMSERSSVILAKTQRSETQSIVSRSENHQDPQFFSFLVKIMNGTLTTQELQERKRKDEKRQKLEEKIKEMQRRKVEEKIKKEFDARSESQMKVQSTNMDSFCDKEEASYMMSLKTEDGKESRSGKIQLREDGQALEDPRKKRTRVTPQMLKQIIKEFEVMAKQQNGIMPKSGVRITFREIGRKFGLGRSSVMKMYSDYCKDPTMKSRFDNKQAVTQNKTVMELTKRRITFVEQLIKKDCTLSQREIAAVMNEHDDLKCKRKKGPEETDEEYDKNPYHQIAYKAISRLMKLANFTRKKVTLIPKNRNSERTLEERYNFCRILNELRADENNKLYFLDECRFNLFTSRDWGWAPKGELATKVRHNSKGKDIMLLAIIGINGLIGYEVSDSYIRGSFTIAVTKMINSIIPENVPENERIYLILDNCPIHNKQCLKEMEQKRPITVLYLPPYSPMLNPIETWFGELKRIVKSKIYKTRQAMKSELIRVLETFRNKSMANYYRGIEKYVQLGLKKELYRGNNKF